MTKNIYTKKCTRFLFILILSIPLLLFSRNNYFDNVVDAYGNKFPINTGTAYNILCNRFSNTTEPHYACYSLNSLPPQTEQYFIITDQKVTLLNTPNFLADDLKVIAIAEPGEMFPLVDIVSNPSTINLSTLPQSSGDWFVTKINDKLAYLKIESTYNSKGYAAKYDLIKPKTSSQTREEKTNYSNTSITATSNYTWVIIIFCILVVLFFIFLMCISTSQPQKPKVNNSYYEGTNTSYDTRYDSNSNNNNNIEVETESEFIQCPSCDGPHDGLFSINRGNGICSYCHGDGLERDLADIFVSTKTKCKECSGTMQCQRCGGTGRIKV